MSSSTTTTEVKPPAWHTFFPAAVSPANWLSREDAYNLLAGPSPSTAGKDFLLVDLRRNDHQGGTIKTSLNLPAQSFHPSIPTLYNLAIASGVRSVIFYCGSSAGRGSRAASWFQDYILSQNPTTNGTATGPDAPAILPVTSYALEGGVRGWANAGEKYTALMDGYDEAFWAAGGKELQ